MIKASLFFALVALVLTAVYATDVATESRSYRKCPCKCFIGRRVRVAIRQCKRAIFRYQCQLEKCKVKGSYYKGKWCCDKDVVAKPSESSTPTPSPSVSSSPSVSPSPSKKPIVCPCSCGKRGAARAMCRYKPYCQVTKCEEEKPVHGKFGYYKPKFQCCYKESYAPKH